MVTDSRVSSHRFCEQLGRPTQAIRAVDLLSREIVIRAGLWPAMKPFDGDGVLGLRCYDWDEMQSSDLRDQAIGVEAKPKHA